MTIWCNTHQRNYERCKNREGGILLPCRTVDLTDILEIEEEKKLTEEELDNLQWAKEFLDTYEKKGKKKKC